MRPANRRADRPSTIDRLTHVDAARSGHRRGGADARVRRAAHSAVFELLEDRRLFADFTLQILHASDAEAGLATIDDAPRFAAIVDALEDTHVNSVLVSGGDNYLPGPFFNAGGDPAMDAVLGGAGTASIGRADIEVMNRIGFEVSAMGNHEFDLGTREIRNLFHPAGAWRGGQFPYLSANINFATEPDLNNRLSAGGLEAATVKGRIAPSAIITENGERIGFVGLTTPEIIRISAPGPNLQINPASGNYDFPALAASVNAAVAGLQGAGVNKIVLLSHLQQFQNEVSLAPLLSGVDVIIAAGSNSISADATDRLRAGDAAHRPYPFVSAGTDGKPTLIVSTDAGYRYLGRMVVTFDEAGVLKADGLGQYLDPAATGAYAADAQGVTDVYTSLGLDPATALTTGKGAAVKQVTDALAAVINAKDGNLLGRTSVFLEGRRTVVRTQETNLGNLTADANLWAARQLTGDATIGISLKNGGGIRDSIGSFPVLGDPQPTAPNPAAGKAAGDVSQLDVENSLRFNNGLSVVSMSGTELARLLEWGFAASGPGRTEGRFPQVGGMRVEVDLTKPAGDRLRTLVATDTTGAQVAVVQNGVIVAPAGAFRMVTLGFLANGGDGYPFSTLSAPARVDLAAASGNAFATAGSEQNALATYLAATFPVGGAAAFGQAETPTRYDTRIRQVVAPDDGITLSRLGTTSVPGGAEISAFDPLTKRLFVTKNSAGVPSLDVIDLTNPSAPAVVTNINLGAFGGEISSVAVRDGIVAAAMIASPKTAPGQVVFLNSADGAVLGSVVVGSQPDMLTFTPDGSRVLVAVEAEAANNETPAVNNPEGGIAVIVLDKSNVAGGSLGASGVAFAGFGAFNGQKAALIAQGARLLADPAVTVAMDLEPEYIAVAPDGLTARVTLQEANAFAVLDIASATITAIQPLGAKDHSKVGNEIDASDRDTPGASNNPLTGNFQRWPVFGLYMPDAVASFTVGGQTYYVTANEGDARPNVGDTADTDVRRVGSLTLDPAAFQNAAFLKDNDNLGRLNVSFVNGDTDGDGDIDRLYSIGARSFSIWDSAGNQVFDTGSEFERLTLALTPTLFNANNGNPAQVDQRSDDKGPEPEGVVTGVVNGRTYSFVGLERAGGGVMVYDVTAPTNPTFVQYIRTDGDVSPEGLVFVPAVQSPTGRAMLIVSNEVSGTVTTYDVATTPVINEFVLNHTGADTFEFVEVAADPNADLSGYSIVQIEGDNSGTAAGVIDSVTPLTAASAGGFWTSGFLSDTFENGTVTLLLVRNFTGAVGDDLDANNDGVLDAAPWSSVADSVAVTDGGSTDRTYATVVLGAAFAGGSFAPGGASRIPNATDTNATGDWRRNDFELEGIPGYGGAVALGEAVNTPGATNLQPAFGPLTPLAIPEIQGAAHVSPYEFRYVQTTGVVTAINGSTGYWLQSQAADASDATSEAIFVNGPTAGVAVGQLRTVTGVVNESGFPGGLKATWLVADGSTVLEPSVGLPAATVIGVGGRSQPTKVIDNDNFAAFDPAEDGIDFYESLEGMRVQVNNAVAVSSNARFGEIAVLADNGATATGPRSAFGGIVLDGAEYHPERIIVDDQLVAAEPTVNTGATFEPIVGVIDYSFGNFKLLNTQPLVVTSAGPATPEVTALVGTATQLTVATFNVENLDGNDPQAKFDAVAMTIVNNLRSPDVLSLQEIQDDNGATNNGTTSSLLTAQRLIDTIVALGGPAYTYVDVAPVNNEDGGEPGGNIRVGFLYNAARGVGLAPGAVGGSLDANGVVGTPSTGPSLAYSVGRIDPTNPAFDDSRKPLVAQFTFNGQTVFVVANHFNSKTGDAALFGDQQPPTLSSEAQRLQQAAIVNDFVEQILAVDPNANVIVTGDLNDFWFSSPLAALADDDLTNLSTLAAAGDRYSYNFDGNSQTLDHILATRNLMRFTAPEADYVHANTDFGGAGRSSDHDPLVARFTLPLADLAYAAPAGFLPSLTVVRRNGDYVQVINGLTGSVVQQPLSLTRSVTIDGVNNRADLLAVDLYTGGFFTLRGGITFNGGTTTRGWQADVIEVLTRRSQQATRSNTPAQIVIDDLIGDRDDLVINLAGVEQRRVRSLFAV